MPNSPIKPAAFGPKRQAGIGIAVAIDIATQPVDFPAKGFQEDVHNWPATLIGRKELTVGKARLNRVRKNGRLVQKPIAILRPMADLHGESVSESQSPSQSTPSHRVVHTRFLHVSAGDRRHRSGPDALRQKSRQRGRFRQFRSESVSASGSVSAIGFVRRTRLQSVAFQDRKV